MSLQWGCTGRSNEQVWTMIQWWPSDVTSRGVPLASCLGEGLGFWGDLHNEVQCIIGNGYMGTPCEQIDTHQWKYYLPVTSLAGGKNWRLTISSILCLRFRRCGVTLSIWSITLHAMVCSSWGQPWASHSLHIPCFSLVRQPYSNVGGFLQVNVSSSWVAFDRRCPAT